MFRRRWYLVVAPAIVGLVIGAALVRVLPKRYTSRALLLVEQQQIPHDFVQPVITENLNARIANIEEQVLSRTRLEPIIQRYNLFSKLAAHHSTDDLVLRLQKAVTLTPLKPVVESQNQTIPGFYLSVTLDNPATAQQVCNDLASMFINEDIRQRQQSAQGTTNFLQSQLTDAQQNLDVQDQRLATFETKYMGMLPDETKTNLAMLGTLNTQLQAVTQDLNRATQSKAYTESMLAQQTEAWKLARQSKDGYIPGQFVNPLSAQLAALQSKLANLKARFTDQYPDVIKTEAAIANLKKQMGESTGSGGSKSASTQPAKAIEPAQLQQLRSQVQAYDVSIKSDTVEQQNLRKAISGYESKLQLSPVIEEEYKKITRDHDTALKFYNSLLVKRDASQMATQLQQRQEGEQLSVMDPASLPDSPSFPKPPKFIGGGLLAGLALGLVAGFGIEQSDKRVRTVRDVEYFLGAPVFGTIPAITTPGFGKRSRSKREKKPAKMLTGA